MHHTEMEDPTDHSPGETGAIMIQSAATFDWATVEAYDAFGSPIPLPAADSAQHDDDAVMDAWLASLAPREFELILSRLADGNVGAFSALEPSA
jgi:hypothetical protein